MASVRQTCGRPWGRCAGAPALDQEPVRGAALRPALGCNEFARDRVGAFEPRGTALPFGRGASSTIDLVGCERPAACGGVFAVFGADDEADPSRASLRALRDAPPVRGHARAL